MEEQRRRFFCKLCKCQGHRILERACPKRLQTPRDDVIGFKGAGDVLSNFYPCEIRFEGQSFASTEHAYQFYKAMHCGRSDVAQLILQTKQTRSVKIISKRLKTSDAWKTHKIPLMKKLIRAKAACEPKYRQKLLQSCDHILAEAVPGDEYWSSGLSKADIVWCEPEAWPGENVMGKLHMELREELREDGRRSHVNIRRLLQRCSSALLKTVEYFMSPEVEDRYSDICSSDVSVSL